MLPRLNLTISEMEHLDRLEWAAGISFRAYGLRIGIRTNNPAVLARLTQCFPVRWKLSPSPVVDYLYSVVIPEGQFDLQPSNLLYANERSLAQTPNLDDLRMEFYIDLHSYVARETKQRVFLHAGVVGWRGQGILIPGKNFSGKTNLVMALLRAGATYYSDEFAVLNLQGRVHPYPTPLHVREAGLPQPTVCPVERLGAKAGKGHLPIGLVVVSEYRRGAKWQPRPLSNGQAVLALLANVMSIRHAPEVTMPLLRQVVSAATLLKGVRGEADETADSILNGMGDEIVHYKRTLTMEVRKMTNQIPQARESGLVVQELEDELLVYDLESAQSPLPERHCWPNLASL